MVDIVEGGLDFILFEVYCGAFCNQVPFVV